MGLGGMCFLELDLFGRSGNAGPWGLFADVPTTPRIVAACVDNDFQGFLNPDCYERRRRGSAKVWHKEYSRLDHMVTVTSCELLGRWSSGFFLEAWKLA